MLHARIANEELSQRLQMLSSSLAMRACSNVEHNDCLKDQLRIKTGAFYEGESGLQEKKASRFTFCVSCAKTTYSSFLSRLSLHKINIVCKF